MNIEEKNEPAPEEDEPESTPEITDTPLQETTAAPLAKPVSPRRKKMNSLMQWVFITIGSLIMAISVYFFQTPNNITLGGVAGIAFILEKIALSQGIWMVIINGALLLLGLVVLGKQCTVKTIYSSALYTGLIYLFELIGKVADIQHPVTGGSTFLALTYSILLFGVGGALIFNCGASSGGTDIIALILKKYTRLNIGVALFVVDFIVVSITIYSVSIEIALYSFMGLFAKSFLLDSIIEGLGRTKYITVITCMPDEIGKYIIEEVNHSYTVYEAKGGYSGEPKKVILTICKRNEAWKLKTKIKQIDPSAFVIISNANEIMGKGFGGTV